MSFSHTANFANVTLSSPEGQALLAGSKHDACAKNRFIQDVVGKLIRFGSISPRQHEAVKSAIDRAISQPVEVVGEAPVGKQELTGVVLTAKVKQNDFGSVLKMLVKFENNSKGWCTVPSTFKCDEGNLKGCKVQIKATWERSKDDASFAFGKRPSGKILVCASGLTPGQEELSGSQPL